MNLHSNYINDLENRCEELEKKVFEFYSEDHIFNILKYLIKINQEMQQKLISSNSPNILPNFKEIGIIHFHIGRQMGHTTAIMKILEENKKSVVIVPGRYTNVYKKHYKINDRIFSTININREILNIVDNYEIMLVEGHMMSDIDRNEFILRVNSYIRGLRKPFTMVIV